MQLVVNSPGTFITQKNESFHLKRDDEKFEISPLKVESIVITNQAMITTQAIACALEHNIDIIFLNSYGDPVGRVWFAKMGSTALVRKRQLEISESEKGVGLVIEMVAQKLENQILFLKKLKHARPGATSMFENPIEQIQTAKSNLENMDRNQENAQNTIMGFEGTAGRAYFQCLSKVMPEKYQFDGRSRRPAKDPFNAVLNYCYGMLYGKIEKACILAGLDPYIGFLHTDDYNKKSMVFDLIEPFRIYADQTAVYLFTGKKIKDDFFDVTDTSASLNKKGKPVVVEAMNNHLEESIRYRKKNVKRKYIPQHEAHRLANILLEDEGQGKPDFLEIKEF